jgi:hypothetical protein
LEDFVVRTLGALPGPLSRLAYIGGLRRNGHYEHWGLSRAYGDTVAGAAMSEAHSQVWLEVLRTPLPKLAGELQASGTAPDQIDGWRRQSDALTPPKLAGGSRRHFHSVLLALSLLPRSSRKKTSPSA